MIEHHRSAIAGRGEPSSTTTAPKQEALRAGPENGCLAGQVDIIAMVRSLQRAAGAMDCFRSGNADCDKTDCEWRTYCLVAPSVSSNSDPSGSKG